MTTKFLVIHMDADGSDDIAEVTGDNAQDALDQVAAYPDTAYVSFAIQFTGDTAPLVYDEVGEPITASEGDALPEEEHDEGREGERPEEGE